MLEHGVTQTSTVLLDNFARFQEKKVKVLIEEVAAGRMDVLDHATEAELQSVLEGLGRKRKRDQKYLKESCGRERLAKGGKAPDLMGRQAFFQSGISGVGLERLNLQTVAMEDGLT